MKNNDIFWLVGGLVAAAVIAKQFAIAGTAPASSTTIDTAGTTIDTAGTTASTGTNSTDVEAATKALADQNAELQSQLSSTQAALTNQYNTAVDLQKQLDLVLGN